MSRKKDAAKKGLWNVLCDRCGFKLKSNEVLEEWTGLIVCIPCYEERHPQDFLKVGNEDTGVPFTRTEAEDSFDGKTYTANPEPITTRYDKGTFTTNNEDI